MDLFKPTILDDAEWREQVGRDIAEEPDGSGEDIPDGVCEFFVKAGKLIVQKSIEAGNPPPDMTGMTPDQIDEAYARLGMDSLFRTDEIVADLPLDGPDADTDAW